MRHYFSDIFVLIIMFLFINSMQTYFHESIHAEICESFGGVATIDYSSLMQGGKTSCSTHDGSIYHIINDMVSYTTSIFVITVFMGLIYLAIIFEKRRIFEEHRHH